MSLFSLHHLVQLLHSYGYTVLAIVIAVESIGLPLPGIAAAVALSRT